MDDHFPRVEKTTLEAPYFDDTDLIRLNQRLRQETRWGIDLSSGMAGFQLTDPEMDEVRAVLCRLINEFFNARH